MDTWVPAITGGGAFGLLAALITYLFAANRTDRQDYRSALRAEEKAHDATQVRLDEQREQRRKAEDALAEAARRLHALEYEVQRLRTQIASLTGEAFDGAS